MRTSSINQQQGNLQTQLKDFTTFSHKSQSSAGKKKAVEQKMHEQPIIRRRYSYENSTGAGYQGL